MVHRERIEDGLFRFGYLAVLAFMFLPLVVVVATSFTQSGNLDFPPRNFSLQWYGQFFASADWLRAFDNSIIIGVGTTVLATFLGVTAALGFEGAESGWTQYLAPVALMPLLIPPVVLGVSLLVYFSEVGIESSYLGIILAHTLWATPLVFFVMQSVLSRFDWDLRDAGMDLGASPVRTFFHVILPGVKNGIIVSALLAFIISLQEFIMALFLSSFNTRTIPVLAWGTLRQSLNPIVSVVSTFLILMSVLGIALAALAMNLEWVAKQL